MRRLTGPAQLLTPLLDGLDATELAAMPEPDAAYKLSYEETPATKLRGELAGMKLKALKVRARDLGVDEELLADADDADDIRGAVVGLILAAAT